MNFINKNLINYYKSKSRNFEFNYLDIGSSAPLNKYLSELHEIFKIKLYEPNFNEFKKLDKFKKKWNNLEIFPYAISDNLTKNLNIYNSPNFSSFYSIDNAYKDFIRKNLIKTSQKKVKCKSLKYVLQNIKKVSKYKKKNISNVLKIDTQGHNINCLKSAGDKIDDFSVILLENDYFPIYQKQSLYYDVGKFLHERKFIRVGNACDLEFSFSKKLLKKNHLYNELEYSSDVIFIKNIFERKTITNTDNFLIIFFLIIFDYLDLAEFYISKSKLDFKIKKKLKNFSQKKLQSNKNFKIKLIKKFINKKITLNKFLNQLSTKKEINSIFRTRI